MVPRIGAFEVSFVATQGQGAEGKGFMYKVDANMMGNNDVLLFSKFLGVMWPHYDSVAERLGRYADQMTGPDFTEFEMPFDFMPYQFNPANIKAGKKQRKPAPSQGAKT